VTLVHGDFPYDKSVRETREGFPIDGITKRNLKNISFQQVMEGKYRSASGERSGLMSAGNYLLVVHGVGGTVSEAAAEAYKVAWQIKLPSNLMFRTDIGTRLEEDLPRLHKQGYAKGMEY
jgi:phosphoribosylamine-glycine ligase